MHFPCYLTLRIANSICYSVQSIRFTTRYNLVQSTYVTDKLSNEVYKHYWLGLIWEWTLGMIQSNKPARAVSIAVSMLQKLLGDEAHINAFLPMITMNKSIHRDTIVATLSLLFTTNLVEGNGLKPHPQAAIMVAFDSLKSPSTLCAYAIYEEGIVAGEIHPKAPLPYLLCAFLTGLNGAVLVTGSSYGGAVPLVWDNN